MKNVVIENPILNAPFEEPIRHFKFSQEGITDEIANKRRVSSYFIPIARPKKRSSKQMLFDTEWTQDRIEENKFINDIRERVAVWRRGQYQGITKTTAALLEHWRNPERDRRLFFCQMGYGKENYGKALRLIFRRIVFYIRKHTNPHEYWV